MDELPRSLLEFERRFPDEEACARWLLARRWPAGFCCPACGHGKGWELGRGVLRIECAGCHRQTSVTAGTVLHRSHLPLKVWFTAAWLVATHRNGISARQLWLQLGLGSYKTAWLLLQKLRRAMVDPGRALLAGLVEVDETTIPFRTIDGAAVDPSAERRRLRSRRGDEPVRGKPGRSDEGRLLIAGAVEIRGKAPGRSRLAVIADYSAATLAGFVAGHVAKGSTVVSDGWSGYARLKDVKHDPKIIGPSGAASAAPVPAGPDDRLCRSWRRMCSCPGCTASSPTPSAGPWVSIMACVRPTCSAISTSSSSASTGAARHRPPSPPCSGSPSSATMPRTRC
jgi:hypothetical protein